MKRKMFAIALTLAMTLSMLPTAQAAKAVTMISPQDAADRLYYYGLFKGTENGFELDRPLTRLEALVMITRLYGLDYATDVNGRPEKRHPFTDVPAWGDKYVNAGYDGMSGNGIINGTSPTTFGSNNLMSSEQFVTLLLRILSYDDSFWVFNWDNPWPLAEEIGLVYSGEYIPSIITRGDAAKLCYRALSLPCWAFYERTQLSMYTTMAMTSSMPMDFINEFSSEFEYYDVYLGTSEDNVFISLNPGDVFRGEYIHTGDAIDRVEIVSSNPNAVKSTILEGETTREDYGMTTFYINHVATSIGRSYVRINLLDAKGNIKDFTYIYVTVEAPLSNFSPLDYPLHPGVPDFGDVVGATAEHASNMWGRHVYAYDEEHELWEKYERQYGFRDQYVFDYAEILKKSGFQITMSNPYNADPFLFSASSSDYYVDVMRYNVMGVGELHVYVQPLPIVDPWAL